MLLPRSGRARAVFLPCPCHALAMLFASSCDALACSCHATGRRPLPGGYGKRFVEGELSRHAPQRRVAQTSVYSCSYITIGTLVNPVLTAAHSYRGSLRLARACPSRLLDQCYLCTSSLQPTRHHHYGGPLTPRPIHGNSSHSLAMLLRCCCRAFGMFSHRSRHALTLLCRFGIVSSALGIVSSLALLLA